MLGKEHPFTVGCTSVPGFWLIPICTQFGLFVPKVVEYRSVTPVFIWWYLINHWAYLITCDTPGVLELLSRGCPQFQLINIDHFGRPFPPCETQRTAWYTAGCIRCQELPVSPGVPVDPTKRGTGDLLTKVIWLSGYLLIMGNIWLLYG